MGLSMTWQATLLRLTKTYIRRNDIIMAVAAILALFALRQVIEVAWRRFVYKIV